MPVHFDKARMNAVADAYERWWRGELDRPLVRTSVVGVYPPSHVGKAPVISQANCHDFS